MPREEEDSGWKNWVNNHGGRRNAKEGKRGRPRGRRGAGAGGERMGPAWGWQAWPWWKEAQAQQARGRPRRSRGPELPESSQRRGAMPCGAVACTCTAVHRRTFQCLPMAATDKGRRDDRDVSPWWAANAGTWSTVVGGETEDLKEPGLTRVSAGSQPPPLGTMARGMASGARAKGGGVDQYGNARARRATTAA